MILEATSTAFLSSDDSKKGKSILDFDGGYSDRTKSDSAANFNEDKVTQVQWRLGTKLYPQRKLANGSH